MGLSEIAGSLASARSPIKYFLKPTCFQSQEVFEISKGINFFDNPNFINYNDNFQKKKIITSQLTLWSGFTSLRSSFACSPIPHKDTTVGAVELRRPCRPRRRGSATRNTPCMPEPYAPACLPRLCHCSSARPLFISPYRHPPLRPMSPCLRLFVWPRCALAAGIIDSRSQGYGLAGRD